MNKLHASPHDQCIKYIINTIKKLNRDKETLEKQLDENTKKICVTYKEIDYHSEQEILEAYGWGMITRRRYELLCNELDKKRTQISKNKQLEQLDEVIKLMYRIKESVIEERERKRKYGK